jgi:hypothetical protein
MGSFVLARLLALNLASQSSSPSLVSLPLFLLFSFFASPSPPTSHHLAYTHSRGASLNICKERAKGVGAD